VCFWFCAFVFTIFPCHFYATLEIRSPRDLMKYENLIDVMVRFTEDADISLFDYIRIMNNLKNTLNKKVDLAEEGQLRHRAQESVEHDKILVYERAN